MNKNLEKLFKLAAKESRMVIGLMSGTSLDGLDVALCNIQGSGYETEVKIMFFESVPYSSAERETIKMVCSKAEINLEKLCLVNAWLGKLHAQMLNNCLQKWKVSAAEIDLIGSHGQTIYHAPATQHMQIGFGNSTLQIGDADHLAVETGIITISDFRQKHIVGGGEGAPLARYADELLFRKDGEAKILLNIGGIANITYLPAQNSIAATSTDTGPGNILMDAFVQQMSTALHYDEGGKIAEKGSLSEPLLNKLLAHPFFKTSFPKTTGAEVFNLEFVQHCIKDENISNEDILCTLSVFTAHGIAEAVKLLTKKECCSIYISGGGWHNKFLLQNIKKALPGYELQSSEALGIHPDAKESILFALLANEAVTSDDLCGDICLGKISFPS